MKDEKNSLTELYESLLSSQLEADNLIKNKTMEKTNTPFLDTAAVVAQLKPLLNRHGLFLTQIGVRVTDTGVHVEQSGKDGGGGCDKKPLSTQVVESNFSLIHVGGGEIEIRIQTLLSVEPRTPLNFRINICQTQALRLAYLGVLGVTLTNDQTETAAHYETIAAEAGLTVEAVREKLKEIDTPNKCVDYYNVVIQKIRSSGQDKRVAQEKITKIGSVLKMRIEELKETILNNAIKDFTENFER